MVADLTFQGSIPALYDQHLGPMLFAPYANDLVSRLVDLRYGPLGPSFRESLRRSFMGVPRIYGFSSVAPRGEVTSALGS